MLPLGPLLQQQREQLNNKLPAESLPQTEQEAAVLTISDFVTETVHTHPEWWQQLRDQLSDSTALKSDSAALSYQQLLQQLLPGVNNENELMQMLRQFKRQLLLQIACQQTLQLCSTEEILRQLSLLAESIIVVAQEWLYRDACQQWGTPYNAQGVSQPLLVIAAGKLGGGELNFSSDIDLLFAYPEKGSTQGGRRQWDNDQFFTRLGQRLIKVLDQQTTEGQAYRVDMRLRPLGESGPLVLSFNAMEEYYQEQGRDWERYAMIKARVLGGDQQGYHQQFYQLLRPFIFRRYIDFSVIQSLRDMKAKIAREVRRRNLHDNIKLGAGGIREIEFIAQVFQLIRGGREPKLQGKSLLSTLITLAQLELISRDQATILQRNYLFLRRLENLLQAIKEQQTQILPDDPLDQARLAWGMSCGHWDQLVAELEVKRAEVRAIFNSLIGEENASQSEQQEKLGGLWSDQLQGEEELAQLLPELSQQDRVLVEQTLTSFRQDLSKCMIGIRGRSVLDQLMPPLLELICKQQQAGILLQRITQLIATIVTRTTYLELLLEHPAALRDLVRLCSASPMIASQLAHYPLLLDELLDPALYRPLPQQAYQDELRQYLLRIERKDEEQQIDVLRQFKQAQLLRIAAADIAELLPVMKVSDHLTWLAEAIIAAVIQQAWYTMQERYGQPQHLTGKTERTVAVQGFAVLAYGKLGGWELGYGSDLDLVFLIDCPADVMTDGPRSIDGRQFYLRLAQRIIHLFNIRTTFGVLYEVDARLRPSGESGLLVTTLEAFAEYQLNEAWVWEHQALIRARMIYGSAAMQQRFSELRQQILCRPRDAEQLRQEVCQMRDKMVQQHQGKNQQPGFDIKHDRYSITDIEFLAQYLVLRYASSFSQLTRWSDNVRIFEQLAQLGVMAEQEAEILTAAYIKMREVIHHHTLQQVESVIEVGEFATEREQIKLSWRRWFGGDVNSL